MHSYSNEQGFSYNDAEHPMINDDSIYWLTRLI